MLSLVDYGSDDDDDDKGEEESNLKSSNSTTIIAQISERIPIATNTKEQPKRISQTVGKKHKKLDVTFLPPEIQKALARGVHARDSDSDDETISSKTFSKSSSGSLLAMLPKPKTAGQVLDIPPSHSNNDINKKIIPEKPSVAHHGANPVIHPQKSTEHGIPYGNDDDDDEGDRDESQSTMSFLTSNSYESATTSLPNYAGASGASLLYASSSQLPQVPKPTLTSAVTSVKPTVTAAPRISSYPPAPTSTSTSGAALMGGLPPPPPRPHSSYDIPATQSQSQRSATASSGNPVLHMHRHTASADLSSAPLYPQPQHHPQQHLVQQYPQADIYGTTYETECGSYQQTGKSARKRDRDIQQELLMGNVSVVEGAQVVELQASSEPWNAQVHGQQQKREAELMSMFKGQLIAQPTKQQNRKHQINSLAFSAAQIEMELLDAKGSRMKTKSETQAKYGW